MSRQKGFLESSIANFATHRVASNLLMMLMILAGAWGLKQLKTQFFPSFELDLVTVQVSWSGAAAEDVEQNITVPIEQELTSVNGIDKVYSTSNRGVSSIRLELDEGIDASRVLDDVKQKIDGLRNLPEESEQPIVQLFTRYENIASVILTGTDNREELRPMVRRFERELLALGIRKIDIEGLPDKELAIQVPSSQLHTLGLDLNDIATRIRQRSLDLPAGTAGRQDGARQIRSLSQQRDVGGFEQLPLITLEDGQLVRLGDIAEITERPQDDQVYLEYLQRPAVELVLRRTEADDTLTTARILDQWLADTRPTLPPGVELITYNESWQLIQDRINLLLRNGAGGLVLVIAMLFLFLNVRVAFWVTVGIPVSFLITLAVVHLIGGSINMISLFGLIMALGIIVDDAIVVGEDTLTHFQQGEPGKRAAIGGAQRMLAPVMASSLTTIAAFLPLLMVGGTIGNILIDIPIVVICVIIASLVECFLILPGHLHHSLKRADKIKPGRFRQRLDGAFNHFRDQPFRRLVTLAVQFRWATVAGAIACLILAIGLVAGGRVKFTFFPTVDGDVLTASVQFAPGTSTQTVDHYLDQIESALREAETSLPGDYVESVIQHQRRSLFSRDSAGAGSGDEYGALYVQLRAADERQRSNDELLHAWRKNIPQRAGMERLSITQRSGGPPGQPIEVKLTGADVDTLKQASLALQDILKGYNGVSNIDDDMPFGREQWIFDLTPVGKALGLNLDAVGRRLRAALDGQLVQIYYQDQDEIEVRVMLPDRERDHLSTLEQLPMVLPNGSTTPLANIVNFEPKRGLDTLKRVDGLLAVVVTADLDDKAANANEVIEALKTGPLEELTARYGIQASFEGKKANERETMADMKMGLIIALALIFIILSWVFGSYIWPLAVMAVIPLGLTGAVFGHLLMGKALTILSLFGLFGLSGIVINDSIVLISFYRKLREAGMAMEKAIVESACQRLRAVLLTSLTTIAGLSPILYETSRQAQFLIPMAISIVFGLAFATVLILLVVPSLLAMIENLRHTLARWFGWEDRFAQSDTGAGQTPSQ